MLGWNGEIKVILTDDELERDRHLRIAREMEIDPTFVPCRDERCGREDLHREHIILGGPGRPIKGKIKEP